MGNTICHCMKKSDNLEVSLKREGNMEPLDDIDGIKMQFLENKSITSSFNTSIDLKARSSNKNNLQNSTSIVKIQNAWRRSKSTREVDNKSKVSKSSFKTKNLNGRKSFSSRVEDNNHNNSTVKFQRKSTYYGGKVNSIKEGFGLLSWEDGTDYIGQFKKDKANGIGKLRMRDGNFYKGEFEDDIAMGYGIFIGSNGEEYEGYWSNDTQNGIGIETLANSHSYFGNFENGKKNGLGVYIWSNGTKYEGEWRDNNIHGYGIYYYSDNKIYRGEFKDNMMNGLGEFSWKDGNKYVGYYVNDEKEGFGLHYWKKPPRIYIGFWKDGKQNGIAKYFKNKEVRYGQWLNGQRIRFFDSYEDAINALPNSCKSYIRYFIIDVDEAFKLLNIGFE